MKTQDNHTLPRVTASEAREEFSEILSRVAYGDERIAIQRRGKDLAVLISMADLQMLEALEDRADLAAARRAVAEAEKKGTTPWEDVKE